MTEQLLEEAMQAIKDKAIQSGTFDDSCSITGDDFDYCIFCGASNRANPSVSLVHDEACIYSKALRYFGAKQGSQKGAGDS